MAARFLVTGFEPYGGRTSNPAYETMRGLDGRSIAGAEIVGQGLPVSSSRLRGVLERTLDQVDPVAVICLGLWPGEAAIRLERTAINVADFEIADNEGARLNDRALANTGPAARPATLPLRAIERALLANDIPARLSASAGTFLCNACMYTLLDLLEARRTAVPAGFIHVPYSPEQVAMLLRDLRIEATLELHQRADLASMALPLTLAAIEIAIAVTVESLAGRGEDSSMPG